MHNYFAANTENILWHLWRLKNCVKILDQKPDNNNTLTAFQFLTQIPYCSLPSGKVGRQQPAIFENWKNLQYLMNHVCWLLIKEYLPSSTKRRKWPYSNQHPLKVGDIARVPKDLTQRGIWPSGLFVDTSSGKDGKVRVDKVKTGYG